MLDKVVIDLVYIGQKQDEKGSPKKVETTKQNIKADLIDNFSAYYYNDYQRNMRTSKNFIIPKYMTDDVLYDGANCELMYVVISNKKYQIKNILKNKKSYLTCILDTQEIGR